MESLVRACANFSSQFDEPTVGLMNSIRHVWTNSNARLTDALARLRSYFSGEQNARASGLRSLRILVPSLLTLLQLNAQSDSPFQTHPITMNTAISSLLIYGLAYDMEQSYPSIRNSPFWTNIVHRVMMAFGSLLLASLASILFTHTVQPVLYAVYIFVYAGPELQNWLHRRIMGEVGEIENAMTLPV